MAHLWRRWRREYLLLLRSAHKAASPPEPEVQIGDVVVIQDDASSPTLWKLGRVLETLPGRDGVPSPHIPQCTHGRIPSLVHYRFPHIPDATSLMTSTVPFSPPLPLDD
ncbi:hypothetical protein HPB48_016404 [Haemaphysalis longicornis]|uniref:DUF5641 domain-containing protein n=1 Tax=Haemaphysalis longicornis TaxID=44386 RepID=A0A9J6FPA7_HAELO|nr:hypothetical protein HPB48_016404 [Haemaphysalis longicornis]